MAWQQWQLARLLEPVVIEKRMNYGCSLELVWLKRLVLEIGHADTCRLLWPKSGFFSFGHDLLVGIDRKVWPNR